MVDPVSLKNFQLVIKTRFQLDVDDPQHFDTFFKDFIQGDSVAYGGFINKVLTVLFPALEDNIE